MNSYEIFISGIKYMTAKCSKCGDLIYPSVDKITDTHIFLVPYSNDANEHILCGKCNDEPKIIRRDGIGFQYSGDEEDSESWKVKYIIDFLNSNSEKCGFCGRMIYPQIFDIKDDGSIVFYKKSIIYGKVGDIKYACDMCEFSMTLYDCMKLSDDGYVKFVKIEKFIVDFSNKKNPSVKHEVEHVGMIMP